MIRAITILCAVAVAASSAIAAQTAQTTRSNPEHARLTAMSGPGTSMSFRFQPDGPGVTTKGTATIRSLFGGQFIEEKIEGIAGGHAVHDDRVDRIQYRDEAVRGDAHRQHQHDRIAETGSFDEETRQFELKADYPLAGDTWHQRTVIQQMSDDDDCHELPEFRHRAGMEGRGDQVPDDSIDSLAGRC